MTSDQFIEQVFPEIRKVWDTTCLCGTPGFRKLISFNYEDYGFNPFRLRLGVPPCNLIDIEFIIQSIIMVVFIRKEDDDFHPESYECPHCERTCKVFYATFDPTRFIRNFVVYDEREAMSRLGYYLVGFQGLGDSSERDFRKVHDFRKAESVDAFLAAIGIS